MSPAAALTELRERLAELSDLGAAVSVLDWDQNVTMPPGGGPTRAEQLATLERIAHERFIDERIGELLAELAAFEGGAARGRRRREPRARDKA